LREKGMATDEERVKRTKMMVVVGGRWNNIVTSRKMFDTRDKEN